jgi:hypothetical protein
MLTLAIPYPETGLRIRDTNISDCLQSVFYVLRHFILN